MGRIELLLLAVSLAMDAFAVSVGKGLAVPRVKLRHGLICGLWFGVFQALMPCIGYFAGTSFSRFVQPAAPWIAFALLALIGANMIRESMNPGEGEADASFSVGTMLALAVATSIDALAAGVTLAITDSGILIPALVIGVKSFVISFAGVYAGGLVGGRFTRRADMAGGIVLIIIGIKILVTGLL